MRVPRKACVANFVAILHNCEKNGVEVEGKKKWAKQRKKQDEQFEGTANNFPPYLRGIAAYLNMVQPEHGGPLLRRVNELLGGPPEGEGEADGKAGDA